jgi:hypothetical protein
MSAVTRKLTAFPLQRPLQGLKNTAIYHHIRNESKNCSRWWVANTRENTKMSKCPKCRGTGLFDCQLINDDAEDFYL